METETFNREGFELCARRNLEHALEVLEAAAEEALQPNESAADRVERKRHENAAATIRELLRPGSSYFGEE